MYICKQTINSNSDDLTPLLLAHSRRLLNRSLTRSRALLICSLVRSRTLLIRSVARSRALRICWLVRSRALLSTQTKGKLESGDEMCCSQILRCL